MKFIVLPALLCLSLCAGAQIHWALKAGAQINTASYKTAGVKNATNNIAGFNAGIIAKVYFDDKVAFVSGIQYNAKGFTVKTLPVDTQKTYRLNYADIPILLQIDLSKEKGKGFYCRLGPSIGVGLYGKETYTGTDGMEIRNKAILSVTGNHFGLFDASLNAMLGYSITQKFFAEAAYAYGIGNINNDPDGPNIKTRVLSVSVGYFLK
ncbi:MAG TPA: porin family protein [Chitinophagaceae bacterium]|nr:porin family protein [Chitinophagaceae bacterium]